MSQKILFRTCKVVKLGNTLAIILPKPWTTRRKVFKGNELNVHFNTVDDLIISKSKE